LPKMREIAQGLVVLQPKQILPLDELKQVIY
jgi:ATP phosphoribosyltransferase